MSTAPFHFQTHPFSSTIHKDVHKSPVNLWLVMVTAIFFFLILSVYNLALAIYNYTFNFREREKYELKNEVLATLGFVLFWGSIAVVFYLFLDSIGYLGNSNGEENYEHPLLKDETGSTNGTTDIVGL
jgi:uncharacterized membrane protein